MSLIPESFVYMPVIDSPVASKRSWMFFSAYITCTASRKTYPCRFVFCKGVLAPTPGIWIERFYSYTMIWATRTDGAPWSCSEIHSVQKKNKRNICLCCRKKNRLLSWRIGLPWVPKHSPLEGQISCRIASSFVAASGSYQSKHIEEEMLWQSFKAFHSWFVHEILSLHVASKKMDFHTRLQDKWCNSCAASQKEERTLPPLCSGNINWCCLSCRRVHP